MSTHKCKSKGLSPGLFSFWFGVLAVAALLICSNAQAAVRQSLPESMRNAEYVGTETCLMCHEKEHREYELSTHARISIKEDDGTVIQGCESCHGPGSVHVDADGGKETMTTPRKNPELCFQCHTDKQAEFKLPYRHPVLEDKMACADCHMSHGTEARPWTATSLENTNEVCFSCHKEQEGPFVFEHEAVREGCSTCHKVHGSINDKMLLARDSNLCLRCHTQMDHPNIGDSGHSGRLQSGACFSGGCHTAVHGSNFDDHLRY